MDIEIQNYLRINVLDMVLVLISTLLIVWIAKKFFWDFAKKYLDKRQELINLQIDQAKNNLEQSIETNKIAKEELVSIRKEASSIIEQAKNDAKLQAKELKDETILEISNLKQKANEDIKQQKVKAIEEMKEEITDIAMLAATKIIKKEIDDKTKDTYVKEFIQEVEKA